VNGATKKLLFVATYFPPVASGGNARQLRFLRYLPEFGWEPTVLTTRASGPVPDPDGVRIVRTLTPSPDFVYDAARKASAVWTAIERACASGDFRPKPSGLCSWCHFQDFCPAFGGSPPAADASGAAPDAERVGLDVGPRP